MDFETAAGILKSIGVAFNQDYEYRGEVGKGRAEFKLPFFHAVKIPFTSDEWCATTMNEGDHYLGGCCGNLSAVQDDWNHIARIGGGWAEITKLAEIAEGLGNHDGGETWLPKINDATLVQEKVASFATLPPWDKIETIWHLVRGHYRPDVPYAPRNSKPRAESLIHVLGNSLRAMDMHLLYEHMGQRGQERPPPPNESEEEKADREELRKMDLRAASQTRARKLQILYRVIPALNELHATIHQMGLEPFEGWAIWDIAADDVAHTHMGQCFFEKRADVDDMLTLWRKNEAEREAKPHQGLIDTRVRIRPVRITVDKGVEYLDESK